MGAENILLTQTPWACSGHRELASELGRVLSWGKTWLALKTLKWAFL